jgi:hypothetical protein
MSTSRFEGLSAVADEPATRWSPEHAAMRCIRGCLPMSPPKDVAYLQDSTARPSARGCPQTPRSTAESRQHAVLEHPSTPRSPPALPPKGAWLHPTLVSMRRDCRRSDGLFEVSSDLAADVAAGSVPPCTSPRCAAPKRRRYPTWIGNQRDRSRPRIRLAPVPEPGPATTLWLATSVSRDPPCHTQ